MVTAVINAAKKADLKISHHREKLSLCKVMDTDVNWSDCGDHFTIYTHSKSYCIPETNIVLYVNSITVKNFKNH